MHVVGWAVGVSGLIFSTPVWAAVMVAPVEVTNLGPGEAEAITQTLASAYRVAQPQAVIPLAETWRAIEQAGGVQEAAKKLGATEYVFATAVRLESRIVITGTRYSANGTALYSAKITATGLDDVEPTSERLAKALASYQTASATQTIDTVTNTEAKRPNRTWSEKVTGFKAGFTYPFGWGHQIAPMMDAGLALRVEAGEHFLEFGFGVLLPADATFQHDLAYGGVYGDIGASFYLAHQSTSPYVGFGLLPRLASNSITNLAAYTQGGVMFWRESSTRLYIDLRIAQNLLPVRFGSSGQYDSNGNYVTSEGLRLFPTEFTLHVGLGW